MRHIVMPLPVELTTVFHDKFAFTRSVSVHKVAFVNIAICVATDAFSVRNAVFELAFIGGVILSCKMSLTMPDISFKVSRINFPVFCMRAIPGPFPIFKLAFKAGAVWESQSAFAVLSTFLIGTIEF